MLWWPAEFGNFIDQGQPKPSPTGCGACARGSTGKLVIEEMPAEVGGT